MSIRLALLLALAATACASGGGDDGDTDTDDEAGTLGRLKASSYVLTLKAKPEYNGKIFCEASSVVRHEGAAATVARPRFALAPQEQGPDGTDDDIPF